MYQRIDYTSLGDNLENSIDPTNETLNNLDYYITSEEEYAMKRMYDLTYFMRGLKEPVMSPLSGIYPAKYEVDSQGEGTYGRDLTWSMKMYKCFYPNCIKPTTTTTTGTTTTAEPIKSCVFGEEGCEMIEEEENALGQNETIMYVRDKRVITINKVTDGVLEVSKMFVDGELKIEPTENIEIIVDNLIVNAGSSFNKRNRRGLSDIFTGKLIVGTAENPVPCDVKVTIKLVGNVTTAEEFGVLGNSIPIGAKALGGYGSIEMHGCKRDVLKTHLANTVSSGNEIVLNEDTDWAVDEEIVIATSNFEHRETEYFTITAVNGRTLTLDKDIQFRHYGAQDTVHSGAWNSERQLHMGASVALLSRNIVVDGSEGAEGTSKVKINAEIAPNL
jgi:hypothetical protein